MATKDTEYTGKNIQVLTDREHVRKRTQIYAGNMNPTEYVVPIFGDDSISLTPVTFTPSVLKVVGEILDNSLDEFAQITTKNKTLRIKADPALGEYTISDNGRGVPIDKHASGKFTPEVVFGSLRSGRNFTDDKSIGVVGQNGVGSSLTNYCSTEFEVVINRDKKRYTQQFLGGATKVSKPVIESTTTKATGTQISFKLDPAVFTDISLPPELVRNRAIEIAMTNPDVVVEYNDERFSYKRGMLDMVTSITSDESFFGFTINEDNIAGEVYVIVGAHDAQDEQMFTWVNSSLLFDGGKCNVQFFNAMFDRVINHLEQEAKKTKTVVTRNDVRSGLLVLANLKIKNPEYDSQAKTRLTGPDFRRDLIGMIEAHWKQFAKKQNAWLASVLERANERHHKQANKKAIEDHSKKSRKSIPGLLDASSKNRAACRILITEGDSAKSQICEVRDPEYTAAYALTGKINNVFDSTPAQALKMIKINELLAALGLTPGKRAVRSELNYGQIIIATDADYDGDDIFTLLVNMFYKFWPELLDKSYEPIIMRLVAPNVCLAKGNQRIHFTTRADYDKVKHKYKGYEVRYYKGLGSMSPDDWNMVLSGETDTLIPIVDDGNLQDTLSLLFGADSSARKEWLTKPPNT